MIRKLDGQFVRNWGSLLLGFTSVFLFLWGVVNDWPLHPLQACGGSACQNPKIWWVMPILVWIGSLVILSLWWKKIPARREIAFNEFRMFSMIGALAGVIVPFVSLVIVVVFIFIRIKLS